MWKPFRIWLKIPCQSSVVRRPAVLKNNIGQMNWLETHFSIQNQFNFYNANKEHHHILEHVFNMWVLLKTGMQPLACSGPVAQRPSGLIEGPVPILNRSFVQWLRLSSGKSIWKHRYASGVGMQHGPQWSLNLFIF